jgi:hypothetical protein
VIGIPRAVYIHVGLPKTGTTYLQAALQGAQKDLAARGVLYPGDDHLFQRHGFWDLLGRRLQGVDQPHVPGSWQRLVETVNAWEGPSVVLSEEFLVNARPRAVRRIATAFEPAEVHVVVTVRDLGRVIGSMWQQEVSKGRTFTLAEYVAAVRDPERGSATAGVAFWLRQDVSRVLAAWEPLVPTSRMHVVVVPPAGSPASALLERFATAIGLTDGARTWPEVPQHNTSVGLAETEVLRRLNVGLGDRLNERQYLRMVNTVVKPALRATAPAAGQHPDRGSGRARSSGRITLPAEHADWVRARSRQMADQIRRSGAEVIGSLDDLVAPDPAGAEEPQPVDERAVAEATQAALVAAVESFATFWWRVRRRSAPDEVERRTRLGSWARAQGYRLKAGALDLADRNRLAAKAANAYLRRTSRD